MQVNQRLRSLPERLVSNESLTESEQDVTALRQTTNEKAQQTESSIKSGAIFTELQQASLDWETLNKESKNLSETLTNHATALDNDIRLLKSDQSRCST